MFAEYISNNSVSALKCLIAVNEIFKVSSKMSPIEEVETYPNMVMAICEARCHGHAM